MDVIPDSPSVILRATHVLAVRIESIRPTPWAPRPEGGVQRNVELNLRLNEVLKGNVAEQAGDPFVVTVGQVGSGSSRIAAMPGVWSNVILEEHVGKDVVLFASTDTRTALQVAKEPGCIQVLSSDEALEDVRTAARIEAAQMPFADAMVLARSVAARLSFPFIDYIWARQRDALLGHEGAFDQLLTLLEEPSLGRHARGALINAIDEGLGTRSPALAKLTDRYAISLFRLLEMPSVQPFHDNIVEVFLPNLLGLHEATPLRSAAEVFRAYPSEQARGMQALTPYHGSGADHLKHWLHAGKTVTSSHWLNPHSCERPP